jgi:hypothetical protein
MSFCAWAGTANLGANRVSDAGAEHPLPWRRNLRERYDLLPHLLWRCRDFNCSPNYEDRGQRCNGVLNPFDARNEEKQSGKKYWRIIAKPAVALNRISTTTAEGGERQSERRGHDNANYSLESQRQ